MTPLQQRILSAFVMSALAGAAVMVGGEIFFTLLAIACAACLFEGWQLVRRPLWARVAFSVYIIAGFGAAYQIRIDDGAIAFLLIAAVIILCDVGAYAGGKMIGGPKLIPTISPNKTWAGLIAGVAAPVVFMSALQAMDAPHLPVHWTAVLALVAVGGDLLESWIKRRAGVKDSGTLIPGHGGFLDRLDSWIAVFISGLVL